MKTLAEIIRHETNKLLSNPDYIFDPPEEILLSKLSSEQYEKYVEIKYGFKKVGVIK